MKAWITAPFDDNGIEEIKIIGKPDDANLQFYRSGSPYREQSCHWYKEGVTWHRRYDDAMRAAAKLRTERVAKASAEAARILALPPLPNGNQ
jgi:hypothetical protein